MLDYNEVKRFFARKMADDWLGQGRFESAMFHTAGYVYELGRKDERNEHPNKLPLSDKEKRILCNILHQCANGTLQESEEVFIARILIRRIENEQ